MGVMFIAAAPQALPESLDTLDLCALDGFLCGVLLQPRPVAPADWLPRVVDLDGRPAPPGCDLPRLQALVLRRHGELERAISGKIAAISVGIVEDTALLDLEYREDSTAEVDFNVIGTDAGTYVELQGTAEGKPFDRAQMDALLNLADGGLKKLFEIQEAVLKGEAAKASA